MFIQIQRSQIMSLFNLFKTQPPPEIAEEVEPIEYCPACKEVLVKVNQNDGVYCQDCGELLSFYVAIGTLKARDYFRSPALPPEYRFTCSRCYRSEMWPPDEMKRGVVETLLGCYACHGQLHAPAGFCVHCWEKLAKNGRCINYECELYQKPEKARFIPIYEVRVPSPHCSACGQPFIVYNKEIGNRKIAEIALGPGGYEWVAEHKGCSKCGSSFEKSNKK